MINTTKKHSKLSFSSHLWISFFKNQSKCIFNYWNIFHDESYMNSFLFNEYKHNYPIFLISIRNYSTLLKNNTNNIKNQFHIPNEKFSNEKVENDINEDIIWNERIKLSKKMDSDPISLLEEDAHQSKINELIDIEQEISIKKNSIIESSNLNEYPAYSFKNPLNVVNPKWSRSNTNKLYKIALQKFFISELRKSFSKIDQLNQQKIYLKTNSIINKKEKRNLNQSKEEILSTITSILEASIFLNVFTPVLAITFIKLAIKKKQSNFASEFIAKYRENPNYSLTLDKFMLKYLMRVHIRANNINQIIKELDLYFKNETLRENFMSTTWSDLFNYAHQYHNDKLSDILKNRFHEYKNQLHSNLESISDAASYFKHKGEWKLYEEVMQMEYQFGPISHITNQQSILRILEFLSEKNPQVALEMFQHYCMKDKNSSRQLCIYGLKSCVKTKNWEAGTEIFSFFFQNEAELRFNINECQNSFKKNLPSIDAKCLPYLSIIFSNMNDVHWYLLLDSLITSFLSIMKPTALEELYDSTLQYPSPISIHVFNAIFKDIVPPTPILGEYISQLISIANNNFKQFDIDSNTSFNPLKICKDFVTIGDICIKSDEKMNNIYVDQDLFSIIMKLEEDIHTEINSKLKQMKELKDINPILLVKLSVQWVDSVCTQFENLKSQIETETQFLKENKFNIQDKFIFYSSTFNKLNAANESQLNLIQSKQTQFQENIFILKNQFIISNKMQLSSIEKWIKSSKQIAKESINIQKEIGGYMALPLEIEALISKYKLRSF